MTLRTIAAMSATAVALFAVGALTASATTVVAGLSIGLVAALLISIKTDDPTRTMHELLIDEPHAGAVAEDRLAA